MANHKSAIKAHKRSLTKRDRNISVLSRIKTFIKKVEGFITTGKPAEAAEAMRKAESEIMKGVSKGVVKKNSGSRKVSRLTKKIKSLQK